MNKEQYYQDNSIATHKYHNLAMELLNKWKKENNITEKLYNTSS